METYFWGLCMGTMVICALLSAAMHDMFLVIGSVCGMLIAWHHVNK